MTTSLDKPVVSAVGAGIVGPALLKRLLGAGYRIGVIASAHPESAEAAARFVGAGQSGSVAQAARADIVLVTTPDRAIAEVAEQLARSPALRAGACVLHASGALASDVLAPVSSHGARTGSLHPLQSFARREEAVELLPGSYFFCEGTALEIALELARAVGGIALPLRGDRKALYHAGAAVLSNGLVALAASAVDLFERAGVPREEALRALLPLARGTVANLERVGLPASLTGPVARGDVEVVSHHVEALAETAPTLLPLYCALARAMVDVGVAKGTLTVDAASRLCRLLDADARR